MPERNSLNLGEIRKRIATAKQLAQRYRTRPNGITSEIAEYEAAGLVGLELAAVRQSG